MRQKRHEVQDSWCCSCRAWSSLVHTLWTGQCKIFLMLMNLAISCQALATSVSYSNRALKKLGQHWHCHCVFCMNFLSDSYFIFQISHGKTFKMLDLGACALILSKNLHKKAWKCFSWIYQFEGDAKICNSEMAILQPFLANFFSTSYISFTKLRSK